MLPNLSLYKASACRSFFCFGERSKFEERNFMSLTKLKAQMHEAVESIDDVAFLQTILSFTKAPIRIDDEPLTDEERQIPERF